MSTVEELLGIRRAVALWEARADAELGAHHGLSLSDYAVLHQLAEAPGGRLRRIDLARRVALTPSGVTRLLGPLERRGIIAREVDGHDARATYAVLTRAGKALTKDAGASLARRARSRCVPQARGAVGRATFQRSAPPGERPHVASSGIAASSAFGSIATLPIGVAMRTKAPRSAATSTSASPRQREGP
jgi:DNA-binding MarR family transcriptional regulator